MIESTGVLAWRTESAPLVGAPAALLMAPPRLANEDDGLGVAIVGLEITTGVSTPEGVLAAQEVQLEFAPIVIWPLQASLVALSKIYNTTRVPEASLLV